MRLLNVHTLEFRDFHYEDSPPYIIASHRWSDDEVTFKEFRKQRRTDASGYRKVLKLCEIVKSCEVEVDWLWIDTVCINKDSATEVAETINSMFKWYQASRFCLAYLHDVRSPSACGDADSATATSWHDQFEDSVWFKRGWTLQELIAPQTVIFLSADWKILGHKGQIEPDDPKYLHSKHDLTHFISELTEIPENVLYDGEKRKACGVSEKMEWMRDRETTRVEDSAYCLLGLFDIFMPPIYGEEDRAHRRLLNELLAKETEKDAMLDTGTKIKKLSGSELDQELAAEEQATEIYKYVSRLVRHGYPKERAVRRLARKWQNKWGVSLDQATFDINQYLDMLEYRAAWAKENLNRSLAQGNVRATAKRYLEAELQQYGYSPMEAYRAVRVRLKFQPIIDSPAYGPSLGAVREEVPRETKKVPKSEDEAIDLPVDESRPDIDRVHQNQVPDIVVTEVKDFKTEGTTDQERPLNDIAHPMPAEDPISSRKSSLAQRYEDNDLADSQAIPVSTDDPSSRESIDIEALTDARDEKLTQIGQAEGPQDDAADDADASGRSAQADYAGANMCCVSDTEEQQIRDYPQTPDLTVRDRCRASYDDPIDPPTAGSYHRPTESKNHDLEESAPIEDDRRADQEFMQEMSDSSTAEQEDASSIHKISTSNEPGKSQQPAVPPDIGLIPDRTEIKGDEHPSLESIAANQ